jgi:hypothetical protein
LRDVAFCVERGFSVMRGSACCAVLRRAGICVVRGSSCAVLRS